MAGSKKKSEWWRGGIIYQIYPRSFADSNNDGVGDLAGITGKLDYIKSLGVDAIWISPFFKSPMKDFGYDVSDYKAIDPLFGSMKDCEKLLSECKKRGLKVMVDLVISHTSAEHPWFVESRKSRKNPKADWFVWADPLPDGSPPNNWLSIFGGSAWEFDAERGQYYLHNFLKSQPDLNFHNPKVRAAVLDVAKFWLEKGVQGFRLDTVNFYFHDKKLRSNPPETKPGPRCDVPDGNPYGMQRHLYDKTQPENLKFLEDLRKLMDRYPNVTSVGEIGDEGNVKTMADYTKKGKRLHMAYSFSLLGPKFSAAHVRETVANMDAGIGGGWACWAFSNHDVVRAVTRLNPSGKQSDAFARMLLALLTTLRGSVCIYEGEELGLPEAHVPFERLQDPYGIQFWPKFKGRDGCRTPMPWFAKAKNAGFSAKEPWLPIPVEHAARAADVQEKDKQSMLAHYRKFIAWRNKQAALSAGDIDFLKAAEPLLAFTRTKGKDKLLMVFNLGLKEAVFDLGKTKVTALNGHGFTAQLTNNKITLPAFGAFFGRL